MCLVHVALSAWASTTMPNYSLSDASVHEPLLQVALTLIQLIVGASSVVRRLLLGCVAGAEKHSDHVSETACMYPQGKLR